MESDIGRHVSPTICRDIKEVARTAAGIVAAAADDAKQRGDYFNVALSGGSTPKALYDVLSDDPYRRSIDWSRVRVFFSDERFVAHDSPESNFHTAQVGLLSRVPIPSANIYAVPTTDVSPDQAARQYEGTIRGVIPGEPPVFDIVFLGMGPDGHTASLFPGTDALEVTDRLVAPNYVRRLESWRITFTYPLIDAARNVVFLVAGEDKADRLSEVFRGGDLPASRVRPTSGRLTWIVDSSAAQQLDGA